MRASGNIALINHLAANTQFIFVDVFTLTLKSGDVLRYTDGQSDITWGGTNYISSGPFVHRSTIKCALGLQVDEMTIVIQADVSHTITVNGQTIAILQSIMRGDLDGCSVLVERLFMPTYGDTSLGSIILFGGRVSDSTVDRLVAQLNVKSHIELLDNQTPRNLYQPACRWNLFDAGCTLLKTSFQTSKLIAAASSASLLNVSVAFANGAPYYDGGTVTFTSGQNIGVSRSIKQQLSTTQIVLNLPLPYVPLLGDGANFYPGCDKTLTTCANKFSNAVNFSGEPFVPVPETAV